MGKFAKVNKKTGMVQSVEDYDRTPQVPDHERQETEFVEVNDGQNVQVGQPLPAEARKQPGQGASGQAPGHGGTPPGQGGTPPGQADKAQPKK